jgi:predicted transcriptional regulator
MSAEEDLRGRLADFTASIISAYVSRNHLPMGELPALIQSVYGHLNKLGQPPALEPEPLVPPVPIKRTVTPNAIISLEDGKPYKTLKRHLTSRGITPEQYRQKWGLPPDYPMTAANYAARRADLAKTSGLGQQRRRRSA